MNFINLNILELYHPVMAKCPHCKDVINLSQLITEEFEDGDDDIHKRVYGINTSPHYSERIAITIL